MGESLNPTLLERVSRSLRPDFARTLVARRMAAGFLVVLAGIIALRPDPAGAIHSVAVARRDLSPGASLTADDIGLEKRSAATLPDGAQTDLSIIGMTLAGPVRRGEVITDARVLNSRLAGLTAGPDARVVPLRLADAAVLDLIRPGDVIDILGAATTEARPKVVATNAVVVLVSAKSKTLGASNDRVVLVALPAPAAHTLAGATLVQTVTVTIH